MDEVVTCGAALQYVLAERQDGGAAFVDRLPGARRPRRRRRAAHRQQHGVRHARRRRGRRRPRGLRLPRAADRDPGGAARRGVHRRRRATATFPMPDGPWPGIGRRAGRGRGGDRAAGRAHRRQAGARHVRHGARPAGRRAATSRSATGSTSTSPARGGRGSTARSCSPAARRATRRRAPIRSPRTWPTRSRRSCCADRDLLAFRASMARRALCLIVNPSAGRGRAARLLPAVEAALRARGLPFRVERTDSLDHARELARGGARRAARSRPGWAATACSARSPASCAAPTACSASCPAAAATTSRASSGSATDPEPACDVLFAGRERTIDVARRRRADLPRDRLGGLRLRRPGHRATRRASRSAAMIYVYATLRALRALAPRALGGRRSTASAHASRGYSVAVANSGMFGGGMHLVPEASLDDGLLDVVLTARLLASRASCSRCRRSSRARTSTAPTSRSCARSEIDVPRRPARSPSTPTAIRSRSCPSPSRSCRAR